MNYLSVLWLTICSGIVCPGFALSSEGRGHMVLIGGGEKPDAVMHQFITLSGGPDALILIVPTASSKSDTGRYYTKLLARYGCTNLQVLPIKNKKDSLKAQYLERVKQAGGIFFSGGDQRRLTQAFLGTELLAAITDGYQNRGLCLGGTSAGTAVMSTPMLTGDGQFDRLTAKNVVLLEAFGFLPGIVVDQHFIARSRQNRLMSVVMEHPGYLGVGVDEATAIWLKPDNSFSVIGDGWVQVYDASAANIRHRKGREGATHLGGTHIRVHILQSGDGFRLSDRTPILAINEREGL